ncbi:DNA polymerase I [uncultured Alsobacter sp.]|uniref:DNA polymerase I n=1 Tax=uncultured Alsobacter sp. TaxID=1748258 RepID=UPI0025DFBF90|nr:DNA polymerase I [uncultured Alsobacter sp.]
MTETATPALRPVRKGDHVFLVDGSSYIFRAYHALPPLTRKSDGLPVGAVAGFCNMLWRLLRDSVAGEKPTHLAVVFDYSATTFRNAMFDGYKAHRPEPPEELRPQFRLIRDAVRAFDLPCVEQQGYEADDIIATYARLACEAGATTTIVASDKDLMQLVGNGVSMYDSMKERRIGRDEVIEKFGVPPEKVVEVQALIGDSVDNVPGVPGIGVKTAAQLILDYGDLETLLSRAGEIKQPKRRESLIQYAEQARLSHRLVMLDKHVPLDHSLESIGVHDPDPRRLIAFLKAMEFTSVTRRVAETYGVDAGAVDAAAELTVPGAGTGWGGSDGAAGHGPDMREPAAAGDAAAPRSSTIASTVAAPAATNGAGEATPGHVAGAAAAAMRAVPFDVTRYETVGDVSRLRAWIAEAREAGVVAVDTETTSLDAMQADLVGVSLATAPGRACYIPLTHKSEGSGDLFGGNDLVEGQIPIREALALLKPLLEDAGVLKIAQNLKYDWLVLERHGIVVAPADDTMLLSYILDAGRTGHGMDELSEKLLGHKPIQFGEVAGTGKSFIGFARVSIQRATEYAAEDADVTLRLWHVLKPRLAAEGMATAYERLERPLVAVLGRMERRGIAIDRQILSRLSGEFAQGMARLESEIHELAGGPFNLGSPKQLGDILFGKMGLPGATKTATGAWSTGAKVLEDLAEQGHQLPARILEWRQLSKLKSTYTDALPGYVHPQTQRVHTCFSLASTTTGRLSSSEPNLQNIPVRTEEGRRIRTAFVATPGHRLVSADYSQIELRILAHIAEIPQLRQAFADGIDIHAMTASEMFGVPVQGMDPMVRRRAKAINFGIIYGISAFGLANQLGIGREEAGAYIKKYFERFPGIRDYMEQTKRFARSNGYVTTLFGRKAHYPQINAKNPSERAFMERAAINAPIQGSAADIIRRAMVRMEPALAQAKLSARMLLQVHDELVFEVAENEVEATLPVVRKVMIDAPHPTVQLNVPLQVDARAAGNWDEAH